MCALLVADVDHAVPGMMLAVRSCPAALDIEVRYPRAVNA